MAVRRYDPYVGAARRRAEFRRRKTMGDHRAVKLSNLVIALAIIAAVVVGGAYYAGLLGPEPTPVEENGEATTDTAS